MFQFNSNRLGNIFSIKVPWEQQTCFFFFPATRSGLHKLREVGKPFPRKWQENEKMKRKWREREKIERKWRGREKMERDRQHGERERENLERMGKWRERYFLPLHVFSLSPLHFNFLILSSFSLSISSFSLHFLILSLSSLHFLILLPFSLPLFPFPYFLSIFSFFALLLLNCIIYMFFSVLLLFAGRLNLRHLWRASQNS